MQAAQGVLFGFEETPLLFFFLAQATGHHTGVPSPKNIFHTLTPGRPPIQYQVGAQSLRAVAAQTPLLASLRRSVAWLCQGLSKTLVQTGPKCLSISSE